LSAETYAFYVKQSWMLGQVLLEDLNDKFRDGYAALLRRSVESIIKLIWDLNRGALHDCLAYSAAQATIKASAISAHSLRFHWVGDGG
jgi:hypothetical protein